MFWMFPDVSPYLKQFALWAAALVGIAIAIRLAPRLPLFRPSARLDVEVPPAVSPGSSLTATVRLRAPARLEVRGLRVGLVGTERWYEQSQGGDATSGLRCRDHEFHHSETVLLEALTLEPGSERRWEKPLVLPPNAPPSVRGSIVDIRWYVRGVLDVPWLRNVSVDRPVRVNPAAARGPSEWIGEERRDGCALVLTVPFVAVPGADVHGEIAIEAHSDLRLHGVRAELSRVEEAGDRKARTPVARQDLARETLVRAGTVERRAVVLRVPADAAPTAVAEKSSLRWEICVVLDRLGRPNYRVAQEVRVMDC